jgi:hypothetical protein
MYFQRHIRNAALASHCDSAELLALLADVMIRIVLEGLRGNDRPVAGTLMIVATGSACTLHPRTEAGAAPMASPPAFCPLYRLLNPGAVWFGDPDPMAYE